MPDIPDTPGCQESSGAAAEVEVRIRSYYAALEQGAPLPGFYASDAEAGALGPVVKLGSGKDEEFTGHTAVAAAVQHVTATLHDNRLESRALQVRRDGQVAWFSDLVWWAGTQDGQPFGSLTRWSGVCLHTPAGWKLLQVHVSEGV